MKLTSLRLKNFRQFYGEQTLSFASGQDGKNVTVVHGHNGSGKTALLNAFVWCLYGETTPDLEEPDRLENERALAEASTGAEVTVVVELAYGVSGDTYVVRRTRTTRLTDTGLQRGPTQLSLWRTGPAGLTPVGETEDDCQQRLHRLLPKSLYPFFFFNGERVEALARPDAFDRVEKGVKTLLDLEVFERCLRHLGQVRQDMERELGRVGDNTSKNIIAKIQELTGKEEALQGKVRAKEKQATDLREEIVQFENKQAEIEVLREETARREQLREKLDRLKRERQAITEEIRKGLSTDGYLGFGNVIWERVNEHIREAHKKGEIPAKIKPQFVDDIIESGHCICGRDIVPGSVEAAALLAWKGSAGIAVLEESISNLSGDIRLLRDRSDRFFEQVGQRNGALSEKLGEIRQTAAELEAIETKLGQQEYGDDAATLAARLTTLREDEKTSQVDLALLRREGKELADAIAEKRTELKRTQDQDERAKVIRRRIEALERMSTVVETVVGIKKDGVREKLDRSVKTIWNSAAIKDYVASITDDFRLVLEKNIGGERQPVYGASTGERQVLALSFVGSLVKAASENLTAETGKPFELEFGGLYPLVMDSPFGSLEEQYRRQVADWIPQLANQVVLFVSNTQWRHEAEDVMSGRIGREYVLELHTAKQGVTQDVTVGGRSVRYVVSSSDPHEQTKIKEVR